MHFKGIFTFKTDIWSQISSAVWISNGDILKKPLQPIQLTSIIYGEQHVDLASSKMTVYPFARSSVKHKPQVLSFSGFWHIVVMWQKARMKCGILERSVHGRLRIRLPSWRWQLSYGCWHVQSSITRGGNVMGLSKDNECLFTYDIIFHFKVIVRILFLLFVFVSTVEIFCRFFTLI